MVSDAVTFLVFIANNLELFTKIALIHLIIHL